MNLPYDKRITCCANPTGRKLLRLMADKKTNLALAADVTDKQSLLALADTVGPEICLFKTHIDIISDFDSQLIDELSRLASKHNFLLFEDRKFADIGNTVQAQYRGGIYRIVDWADCVTVHAVAGPGSILSLKEIAQPRGRAGFLLVEMSSSQHLMTAAYRRKAFSWLDAHRDFMTGIITQHHFIEDPGCLHLTPGVHLAAESDSFGQQYITPACAIQKRQSDIVIVGRSIYQSKSPGAMAAFYRKSAWQAYEARLG